MVRAIAPIFGFENRGHTAFVRTTSSAVQKPELDYIRVHAIFCSTLRSLSGRGAVWETRYKRRGAEYACMHRSSLAEALARYRITIYIVRLWIDRVAHDPFSCQYSGPDEYTYLAFVPSWLTHCRTRMLPLRDSFWNLAEMKDARSDRMTFTPPSTPPPGAPTANTPPFSTEENFYNITCEGTIRVHTISARITGFFYEGNHWTCYRRNHLEVAVSYTLAPWASDAPLYLFHGTNKAPQHICYMAVSLSAAVDETDKSIQLIRHTSKRKKGEQLPLDKVRLEPTPPHNAHQRTGPANHVNHIFKRIQFHSATAIKGKPSTHQQYYITVELWANIQNPQDEVPSWVKVAAKSAHSLVVRGRSPKYYQNKPNTANASRGGLREPRSDGPRSCKIRTSRPGIYFRTKKPRGRCIARQRMC